MSRSRVSAKSNYGDNEFWLGISRSATHPDGWRTPTIEDSEHPGNRPKDSDDTLPDNHSSTRRRRDTEGEADRRSDMFPIDTPAEAEDKKPKHLTWKQRIKHVTWAWFTLCMATGGIASVLYSGMRRRWKLTAF